MADPTQEEYLYYARKFLRRERRKKLIDGLLGTLIVVFAIDAAAGSMAGFAVALILFLIAEGRRRSLQQFNDARRHRPAA